MAKTFTFVVRDSGTIRDGFVRTMKNGLIRRGVSTPNVGPGSDWYLLGQAVGNQLAVTEANAAIQADEMMPDTAQDNLPRICAIYKITQQPAAGSIGTVVLSCSQPCSIATETQLVDGSGLLYFVQTGGIFNDQDLISIAALSEGEATNLEEGDILRWVSTPPFSNEKAAVGPGGLVNGTEAEDLETLRARLLDRLQSPPGTGNAAHVAILGEASTPSVQKFFVYPALQGGATMHAAGVAAPTATNKSRDVASSLMLGKVVPYVVGALPEHVASTITTANNVDADVAFGLVLPESTAANPPGPGGGWKNAAPWPSPDAASTWRCTVTSKVSDTVFTVDAVDTPTATVSQIAWLSPLDWKLYEATVVAVSGSAGAYQITLDSPFLNIPVGAYIWPDCENAQAYCDAVLASFALMGPGEKTANTSALIRGFRRPRPATSWPYSLGGHLTQAVTNSADEVESAQFFYRTDGTTIRTGAALTLNPAVPGVVTNPPNIFRPRHIAFYRVP